ncbi:MAG: hypothetical protein D6794_06160 [Deltaproteobacteria bacterium]|nr:MAG: hypothetical protein D6794_06160 [Deltaproteobacteria bacterium]
MFPNWRALQDAYFGLDEAARRAFLTQNPALRDYWQWKREYAAANPKLAPYIMGEDSLSKAILGSGGYRGQGSSGGGSIGGNGGNIGGNGGEGYKGPPVLTRAEMRAFSPALVRQLYGYFYAGHKLGTGAQRELQRVLDMSGRDMRLGEYLEQIVKPSFRP